MAWWLVLLGLIKGERVLLAVGGITAMESRRGGGAPEKDTKNY